MRSVVPEKFTTAGSSFLPKVQKLMNRSSLSSIYAFPTGAKFDSQDVGEEVVLIVRQHPATFIYRYMLIIFLLIIPFLFAMFLDVFEAPIASKASLGIGSTIVSILLAVTVGIDTFLKWFYSVYIVTDQRIIDIDFVNILYHRVSEAQLEKIEDITHKVAGFLGGLFDFGTVFIQTAGSKGEFEFDNVPKPREVQDIITDLLELKQNGSI